MQGTHTFFNVKAAIRYKYHLQEKIKSALQVDNVEKLGILDDDHLVPSCGTLPLKLRPGRWTSLKPPNRIQLLWCCEKAQGLVFPRVGLLIRTRSASSNRTDTDPCIPTLTTTYTTLLYTLTLPTLKLWFSSWGNLCLLPGNTSNCKLSQLESSGGGQRGCRALYNIQNILPMSSVMIPKSTVLWSRKPLF